MNISIINKISKTKVEDLLSTLKIINNKIEVTSEAQVPGANFKYPIPNKVTNNKLILFIIF